jgi:hypothetical protein
VTWQLGLRLFIPHFDVCFSPEDIRADVPDDEQRQDKSDLRHLDADKSKQLSREGCVQCNESDSKHNQEPDKPAVVDQPEQRIAVLAAKIPLDRLAKAHTLD